MMSSSIRCRPRLFVRTTRVSAFLFWAVAVIGVTTAFVPPTQVDSILRGSGSVILNPRSQQHQQCSDLTTNKIPHGGNYQERKQRTELYFMGSDGGILGIGTPEVFTILLVGYFVLGPSELYKLTKEIGKFVQNFRTFSTEAAASLENNFESQLQLEEIRKAQRELNDAFSFRRSINVDSDTDPFEVNVKSPRPDDAFAGQDRETASPTVPAKKKRVRRIKKQKAAPVPVEDDYDLEGLDALSNNLQQLPLADNVPDLDAFDENEEDGDESLSEAEKRAMESMREARDQLKRERTERLQQRRSSSPDGEGSHVEAMEAAANEKEQQSRFQQQLSGDWNAKILENSDKLDPLANIMDRLALLEDQKIAADKRLQEEFKLREENEERYYREKKKLLEEAAAQVQASAYESVSGGAPTTREGVTKK